MPASEIGVPAVVVYELEVGIAKSAAPTRMRRQLGSLLDTLTTLPFERSTAQVAGRIRSDLERTGTPIGPIDVLIAGTALSRGATLVTRNVSEFGRVGGLSVENWYSER